MRLFVAVDLDDGVRASVQQITIALRQRMERLKHATRIGWVSPDRQHLTLAFVGEVNHAIAADVNARSVVLVGSACSHPPAVRRSSGWE